ncbi:hypothetical protein ACP275_11G080500 [Erythranthe tilingii]
MPFSLFIFSLLFSLHCTLTTCIIYSLSLLCNIYIIIHTNCALSLSPSISPFCLRQRKSAVFCLRNISTTALTAGDDVTFRPETAEILISTSRFRAQNLNYQKSKSNVCSTRKKVEREKKKRWRSDFMEGLKREKEDN